MKANNTLMSSHTKRQDMLKVLEQAAAIVHQVDMDNPYHITKIKSVETGTILLVVGHAKIMTSMGSLTIANNGSYSYQPETSENYNDSFLYELYNSSTHESTWEELNFSE